jgi:hypothetical protein
MMVTPKSWSKFDICTGLASRPVERSEVPGELVEST